MDLETVDVDPCAHEPMEYMEHVDPNGTEVAMAALRGLGTVNAMNSRWLGPNKTEEQVLRRVQAVSVSLLFCVTTCVFVVLPPDRARGGVSRTPPPPTSSIAKNLNSR